MIASAYSVNSDVPVEKCEPSYRFDTRLGSIVLERHSEPYSPAASASQDVALPTGYWKSVQWSPDGSCLLTNCEDTRVRVYEPFTGGALTSSAKAAWTTSEGELIYDLQWYPLMHSAQPASCFIAVSSRQHPVHLLDAFQGRLRATLPSLNAQDQLISPLSLSFSIDGQSLLTGFSHSRVDSFDLQRPQEIQQSCKGVGGVPGMISCLQHNPNRHEYDQVVALASYSGYIAVHDRRSTLWRKHSKPLLKQKGPASGISQLLFSPCGHYLFASPRKKSVVACWDVRMAERTPPLHVFYRPLHSNQKISMDLDMSGHSLVTGGDDGTLRLYDIHQTPVAPDTFEWWSNDETTAGKGLSSSVQNAHHDCINGVSCHPNLSHLVASCSGQRPRSSCSLEEDDSEDDERVVSSQDYSLKLWQMSTDLHS